AVLVVTFGLIIGLAPLLYWLRFDFNPLNLRSTKVESVATFLDLRNDPSGNVNAVEVLAPTLADADKVAEKLRALSSVARVITLSSFIRGDQKKNLPLTQNAAKELEASLNPTELNAPPSDAENIAALNTTAQQLTKTAGNQTGPGAAVAKRLAGDLT